MPSEEEWSQPWILQKPWLQTRVRRSRCPFDSSWQRCVEQYSRFWRLHEEMHPFLEEARLRLRGHNERPREEELLRSVVIIMAKDSKVSETGEKTRFTRSVKNYLLNRSLKMVMTTSSLFTQVSDKVCTSCWIPSLRLHHLFFINTWQWNAISALLPLLCLLILTDDRALLSISLPVSTTICSSTPYYFSKCHACMRLKCQGHFPRKRKRN